MPQSPPPIGNTRASLSAGSAAIGRHTLCTWRISVLDSLPGVVPVVVPPSHLAYHLTSCALSCGLQGALPCLLPHVVVLSAPESLQLQCVSKAQFMARNINPFGPPAKGISLDATARNALNLQAVRSL